MSNLKKINSQQKHAIRIIYSKKKYETVHELPRSIKILNVYQIHILNSTVLMHQISTKAVPNVFLSKFEKSSHLYPTRFSNISYIRPTCKLNKCKFRISILGPNLWKEFLSQTEKEIESTSSFKIVVKHKLLSLYNEFFHF